jgi:hypothetical protein
MKLGLSDSGKNTDREIEKKGLIRKICVHERGKSNRKLDEVAKERGTPRRIVLG